MGLSWNEIAKQTNALYNCNRKPGTLKQCTLKDGEKIMNKTTWINRIKDLVSQGNNYKTISRVTGLAYNTVLDYASEGKIRVRPVYRSLEERTQEFIELASGGNNL